MPADDCTIHCGINSPSDITLLQRVLNHTRPWWEKRAVYLNSYKCPCVSFTRKHYPVSAAHTSDLITHPRLSVYKHLDIYFSSDFTWKKELEYVSTRASGMLKFIRETFTMHNKLWDALLYTNITPILEYACIAWDHWYANLCNTLKSVQNRVTALVSQCAAISHQ